MSETSAGNVGRWLLCSLCMKQHHSVTASLPLHPLKHYQFLSKDLIIDSFPHQKSVFSTSVGGQCPNLKASANPNQQQPAVGLGLPDMLLWRCRGKYSAKTLRTKTTS